MKWFCPCFSLSRKKIKRFRPCLSLSRKEIKRFRSCPSLSRKRIEIFQTCVSLSRKNMRAFSLRLYNVFMFFVTRWDPGKMFSCFFRDKMRHVQNAQVVTKNVISFLPVSQVVTKKYENIFLASLWYINNMGDIFENVEFIIGKNCNVAKFPTLARLIIRKSESILLQNVNIFMLRHLFRAPLLLGSKD